MYCSTPLPVQRWRAEPPITARVKPVPRPAAERPYTGPPAYRGGHPRWGFPPVVWRSAATAEPEKSGPGPLGRLRLTAWLCVCTALVTLGSAAAEFFRYELLLAGRTEVLSGRMVLASDRLVTWTSTVALLLAVVTVIIALPLLVHLHGFAARRAGLAPSRAPAAVLARLVIPGWNLYGVGVVTAEIDGLLAKPRPGSRTRMSRPVLALWCAWVIDAVLVLVTLVLAFGRSEQSMANTVELHIFVDLAGCAVALLGALVFRRFRRLLTGPRPGPHAGWVVQDPEPTRGGARVHVGRRLTERVGRRSSGRFSPLGSDTVALCPRRPECVLRARPQTRPRPPPGTRDGRAPADPADATRRATGPPTRPR